MRYVFEKGYKVPLCAYDGLKYYRLDTGNIIDNLNVIEFIDNGIHKKSMSVRNVSLRIYKIRNDNNHLIGFNYVVDGTMNFLDPFKQPFTKKERGYVIEKISNHYFHQELIWGEENE